MVCFCTADCCQHTYTSSYVSLCVSKEYDNYEDDFEGEGMVSYVGVLQHTMCVFFWRLCSKLFKLVSYFPSDVAPQSLLSRLVSYVVKLI